MLWTLQISRVGIMPSFRVALLAAILLAAPARADIVQISPASTATELTDRKLTNVFRVCGRNDDQGLLAAAYVADHFKGKRIAIVDDKSTFGKGVADQFRKGLNAHAIKEVMNDSI